MSKPLVLSLDSPKVRAVLADLDTMQRWEILRSSGKPCTVAELAAGCSAPADAVQRSLDLLVDAGFAARVMATTRRPQITYRCDADELFVAWDRAVPEQLDFVAALRLKYRDFSRRLLDRHDGDANLDQLVKRGSSVYSTDMLEEREIVQLLAAIHAIEDLLELARLRAEARARAGQPRGPGSSAEPHTRPALAEPAAMPYHLCLEFRPLQHQEPAIPAFALWDKEYVETLVSKREQSPANLLTAKELEVAARLAAGESRPTIARKLGISPNTVAATSKRIYAKLGVNNRAAIASRMAGA